MEHKKRKSSDMKAATNPEFGSFLNPTIWSNLDDRDETIGDCERVRSQFDVVTLP